MEKTVTNDGDVIFGEIIKNKTTKIIVATREYKGARFIDIRTFTQNNDNIWIPTTKGITLSPKQAVSLIDILTALKD